MNLKLRTNTYTNFQSPLTLNDILDYYDNFGRMSNKGH